MSCGPTSSSLRLTGVLLAVVLALGSAAAAQSVELESQVFDIGRQLRCPACVSESVADSSAQIAIEMRQIIQQQLQEGRNEAEILAFFQNRYGDWILLTPPKRDLYLLVWLLPVIASLGGVTLLLLLMRRWQRTAQTPLEADEEALERVRAALQERTPEGPEQT